MLNGRISASLLITSLLGLLGILAPIIWDVIKSESKLQMRIDYTSQLVSEATKNDHIEMFYNKVPISNLIKVQYRIINNGNRPVQIDDFISPIKIIVSEGKILSSDVINTVPKNNNVTLKSNDSLVEIGFNLLNPGEYFVLSMLIDGASLKYEVFSRIKGISEIEIDDKNMHIKYEKKKGAEFYIVFVITSIMVFCVILFIPEIIKRHKLLKQLSDSGYMRYISSNNQNFIDFVFPINIVSSERKVEIINMINSLIQGKANRDLFSDLLRVKEIVRADPSMKIFLIGLFLSIIGILYCITYMA